MLFLKIELKVDMSGGSIINSYHPYIGGGEIMMSSCYYKAKDQITMADVIAFTLS